MNAVNDIKLRRQYLPDRQNRFGKRILALADKTKSTGNTERVITLDAKSTVKTERVITLDAKSIGKMKRVITLNAKSTVLPARMGRGAPMCAPLGKISLEFNYFSI
jgi:hypothetical protein